MSFSSHRRLTLDSTLPLSHRASHARSCAVVVCEKWRVERSVVIEAVRQRCGVDLMAVKNGEELILAMQVLEDLRFNGLGETG